MSERLFLKEAEGRIVRRESDGARWLADGDWTERTRFIRRRLADGDLIALSGDRPPRSRSEGVSAPSG